MLRTASILVTVLSLLACPLACVSQAVAGSTAAGESAKACSCCCSHVPVDDGGRSHRRDAPWVPSDECGNCLCHGALITKNDLSLAADAPLGMLAFAGPVDAGLAAPRLSACAIDAAPPGVRSGRLIRYELQSLLL